MTAEVERTPLGLFAAAVALVLPIAYSPAVAAPFWTPKAALLPLVAAVGCVLLAARPAPELTVATWWARGFLLAAGASTLAAGRPGLALLGRYGLGTGLVFVAAMVGAWTIGTRVGPADIRLVECCLLAAVLCNVVLVFAQVWFDLRAYGFGRFEDRPTGLVGNPVYLAPLLLLAVVLSTHVLLGEGPARPRRRALWAVVVLACAGAMSLAGSRTALLLCFALVAWASHDRGPRVAMALAASLAVGWLAGPAVDRPPPPPATSSRLHGAAPVVTRGEPEDKPTAARPTGVVATVRAERRPLGPRLATWWAARHSLAERPLLGGGPGQFLGATIRHRPLSVERDGPGRYFGDAHNLIVEYAVTTGLAGLTALLGWLAVAARRARGAALAGALVILAGQLIEPQFVGVTPLALLLLGLAAPRSRPAPAARRALLSAAAVVGVAGSVVLLVGDFDLRQAALDYRATPARQADALLRPWPQPALALAHIATFHGTLRHSASAPAEGSPAALAADRTALAWLSAAARRDPTDPSLWTALADFEAAHGRPHAARRHYLQAVALSHWSTRAAEGLAALAVRQGEEADALRWLQRAAEVNDSDPPTVLRRMVELHRRERVRGAASRPPG